ncbi:hypothetical protein [Spirosoma pollinicola]|nr:hypothetical protein [Spirosoma pollinicola]
MFAQVWVGTQSVDPSAGFLAGFCDRNYPYSHYLWAFMDTENSIRAL